MINKMEICFFLSFLFVGLAHAKYIKENEDGFDPLYGKLGDLLLKDENRLVSNIEGAIEENIGNESKKDLDTSLEELIKTAEVLFRIFGRSIINGRPDKVSEDKLMEMRQTNEIKEKQKEQSLLRKIFIGNDLETNTNTKITTTTTKITENTMSTTTAAKSTTIAETENIKFSVFEATTNTKSTTKNIKRTPPNTESTTKNTESTTTNTESTPVYTKSTTSTVKSTTAAQSEKITFAVFEAIPGFSEHLSTESTETTEFDLIHDSANISPEAPEIKTTETSERKTTNTAKFEEAKTTELATETSNLQVTDSPKPEETTKIPKTKTETKNELSKTKKGTNKGTAKEQERQHEQYEEDLHGLDFYFPDVLSWFF